MFNIPYKKDSIDNPVADLFNLPKEDRPTAIFAGNNFIAVNIIKSLREHGLRVPEDIAIVCFDDFEPIANFNSFLTTASQPAYSLGHIGIQFLIERVQQIAPEKHRNIVLSPEIMIRQSSISS